MKSGEAKVTINTKDRPFGKKLFHPLEIFICGDSDSGKTTLIDKLIKMFPQEYQLGYVKHDVDKLKKDHPLFLYRELLDSDIVFVEGYKDLPGPKILMWTQNDNKSYTLLKKYLSNNRKDILAIVGLKPPKIGENLPWFHRDNLNGIYRFIRHTLESIISSRPLYGLVLIGGRSTRMGKDKAELSYHGKSQAVYLCDLLANIVDKVYISCRFEQKDFSCFDRYEPIPDRFLGFGPTGGILSAFQKHPQVAWFVIACDMPFIDRNVIEYFVEKRNPYRFATCFYNPEKKWPEPLFAIYEPKSALKLGDYLSIGMFCPRKILTNSRIEKLNPLSLHFLSNVNTPEEFKAAYGRIQTQTKEYFLENSLL